MSAVDFEDYLIRIVSVPRKIAESEFGTFTGPDGKYVGCLIPGGAILSEENPNNENKIFAAYSLIAAACVCELSWRNDYGLASKNCQTARDMDEVFSESNFYAIFKKSDLKQSLPDFNHAYFVSLFSHGLLLSDGKATPIGLPSPPPFSGKIPIKENSLHPDFIYEIFINLIPYTGSPFLRFFYLYQAIEYLMSGSFQKKYVKVKSELDKETDISVTSLRDIMDKLTAATKEKTRINEVLMPECNLTKLQAENILGLLSVDYSKFSFAESIYKIRNIVFHDFPKIHHLGKEIGDLSDNLLRYLMEQKFT